MFHFKALLTAVLLITASACAADEGWTATRAQTIVRIDPTTDNRAQEAWLLAVDRWNDALGFEALRAVVSAPTDTCGEIFATVGFIPEMDAEHGWDRSLGYYERMSCRGVAYISSDLFMTKNPWLEVTTDRFEVALLHLATHELGHALGLEHDHDDVESSLMTPGGYNMRWAPDTFILPEHVAKVQAHVAH